MAPVYADHPFPLMSTPTFEAVSKDPNYKTDKFDEIASEMANVHNIVIRGLNSIYLQAQHIRPKHYKPFCRYIIAFHGLLHGHHTGEETILFPKVEKMAGVEGMMEGNVEQHRVFHDGLEGLKQYAEAVVAGKETYEGEKVVKMIEGFGESLVKHLADEIPSLLGLRAHGEKMAELEKAFEETAQHSMKTVGMPSMVWCFANLDVHRENDMWINWPPAPAPLKFLLRTFFWWFCADSRKFGSTDRRGNLRPLQYVASEPAVEGKSA